MSLGYAEKLSYREDVGNVGMPEIFDSPELLHKKIEELAVMVRESKHLVVFTGAGISTSSGIPDFRGPKGVWTLQRSGKGVPGASLPFHRAVPTLTHMALVELEKTGRLKFVISQNVDSLHLRSGLPREKLAELHGNSFKEICPSCKKEYLRDFEIETIGLKDTPRRCSDKNCGARLKDTVLDWEVRFKCAGLKLYLYFFVSGPYLLSPLAHLQQILAFVFFPKIAKVGGSFVGNLAIKAGFLHFNTNQIYKQCMLRVFTVKSFKLFYRLLCFSYD